MKTGQCHEGTITENCCGWQEGSGRELFQWTRRLYALLENAWVGSLGCGQFPPHLWERGLDLEVVDRIISEETALPRRATFSVDPSNTRLLCRLPMLLDMMLSRPVPLAEALAAVEARLCRTMRPLLSSTSLSGLTNTPYLGLHSKYRTPPTVPSLRPVGVSNSTPTQRPGENCVGPRKETTPVLLYGLIMTLSPSTSHAGAVQSAVEDASSASSLAVLAERFSSDEDEEALPMPSAGELDRGRLSSGTELDMSMLAGVLAAG